MNARAQRTFAKARIHLIAVDALVDYLQIGADQPERDEAERLTNRLNKEADRLLEKGHAQLIEKEPQP